MLWYTNDICLGRNFYYETYIKQHKGRLKKKNSILYSISRGLKIFILVIYSIEAKAWSLNMYCLSAGEEIPGFTNRFKNWGQCIDILFQWKVYSPLCGPGDMVSAVFSSVGTAGFAFFSLLYSLPGTSLAFAAAVQGSWLCQCRAVSGFLDHCFS